MSVLTAVAAISARSSDAGSGTAAAAIGTASGAARGGTLRSSTPNKRHVVVIDEAVVVEVAESPGGVRHARSVSRSHDRYVVVVDDAVEVGVAGAGEGDQDRRVVHRLAEEGV